MARVHIRLAAKLPRLRTVIVPADASRGKELSRLLRQEHGLEVDEWEGPHAKCEGCSGQAYQACVAGDEWEGPHAACEGGMRAAAGQAHQARVAGKGAAGSRGVRVGGATREM